MIIPEKITNHNRTQAELEEFLLFAILVAGKKASTTAKKLDSFITMISHMGMGSKWTPFDGIGYSLQMEKFAKDVHNMDEPLLERQMRLNKLGQYKRIGNAFRGVLKFKGKLKRVSVEELESVKGIGPKTARFFILHSRPDQQVACLDTHILKWMGSKGYKVPKTTPSKKKYRQIESDFLHECHKVGKKVADMDLEIWKSYAK